MIKKCWKRRWEFVVVEMDEDGELIEDLDRKKWILYFGMLFLECKWVELFDLLICDWFLK